MEKITVVVPIFNDEENVKPFINKIKSVLSNFDYEIIFCLDPSEDNTESKLLEYWNIDKRFKILKFSRRYGQSLCIKEGIYRANGDYVVIIDIDFQDPPELIPKMFDLLKKKNAECVYGKRLSRKGENFLKKILVRFYYFLINKFTSGFYEIPKNVGEFRLITRKLVNHLKDLDRGDFLRGDVPFIGFRQIPYYFDRDNRKIGKSKYIIGSIKGAIDGIVNFTNLFTTLSLFFVFFFFVLIIISFVFENIAILVLSFGLFGLIMILYFTLTYLKSIIDNIKGNNKVIIEKFYE